ncbi:MAG: hypothetical protein ACI8R4_003202 [Paracoccaceae bacterium]|jgi:hypothetical protein
MAQADISGTMIDTQVLDLLQRERGKALSSREWKFRLAGYGYAIKDVMGRQIVMSLPHGVELGVLPSQTA